MKFEQQQALVAEARARAVEEQEAKAAARERWRVTKDRSAERVKADAEELLVSELGPSLLALVAIRDGARTRPEARLKAAQELVGRVLGPVAGPQVTVNVDSSLMALARRLDGEGMTALRARAQGDGPPGVIGELPPAVDSEGESASS